MPDEPGRDKKKWWTKAGPWLIRGMFVSACGCEHGGLVVLTPLIWGLRSGRLPTEVSSRGAKWDLEEAASGLKATEERIDKIEEAVRDHGAAVVQHSVEIENLKASTDEDDAESVDNGDGDH